MAITRGQIPEQIDGKLRGARKKKAPLGYHFMPNGKLMKDSDHAKKKSNSKKAKVQNLLFKSGTIQEVVQPQKGEVIHSQCRGTEIKGEKHG